MHDMGGHTGGDAERGTPDAIVSRSSVRHAILLAIELDEIFERTSWLAVEWDGGAHG